MDLRSFKPTDLDDLVALTIDTFGPFYEESFRSIVGDRIFRHQHGSWREDYRCDLPTLHDPGNDKHVVVATSSGAIVGFVAWFVERGKRHGVIHYLAVDKHHRREGVASALYGTAIDAMRRAGVEVVALGTGGDSFHQPARAFYESRGMVSMPGAYYFLAL